MCVCVGMFFMPPHRTCRLYYATEDNTSVKTINTTISQVFDTISYLGNYSFIQKWAHALFLVAISAFAPFKKALHTIAPGPATGMFYDLTSPTGTSH